MFTVNRLATGYESVCIALMLCELALALTFLVKYVLMKKEKIKFSRSIVMEKYFLSRIGKILLVSLELLRLTCRPMFI